MAAPATLSLGVDLEEYSRFEKDKDTIKITLVAGVPTSDVAVSANIGDVSLQITNTVLFLTTAFPYNVNVGKGTGLEVITVTSIVGNTLNLSAPLTKAHAKCELVQQIVDFTSELVSLQLVKARRNRDVVVATEEVTLTGNGPNTIRAQFYLPDILDQNAAPRVRRGSYFVRAVSITQPLVSGISPDFFVSIITVDRFRREYLHGVDHQALDTEVIKNQPVLVTGVTVDFVSRGHQKGWIPLSFNYSDPGGCGTPVRLLTWCDGPAIAVQAGKTHYTLRKGKSQSDYIDVTVIDINSLPTQSTAEDLLIDREPLTDAFFRGMIDRAISWTEENALMCFIEPTRVVTEIDPNQITYAAGSDIPIFVQADWDKRVDALTYSRPAPGHWINFRMPYYPTITFNSLYGKVSNVRIVDIALEWVEIDEVGGFVELVPFNQEIAFNFIGLIWVESLRGPVPIPNFWNFDALVGFRQTPAIILELIQKKAAIDALTLIGQAWRPGISSQSVSRDGVSESVSYLTSGMYGIFSATIHTYTEWIDKNLPLLRGAYKGLNLCVL